MTHDAPHDAELIEADARRIYEDWLERDWAGEGPPDPWATAPDVIKAVCRSMARNPYSAPR